MVINHSYCKYKGKIYNCSVETEKTILRSFDDSDYIIRCFQLNPSYSENPLTSACKYFKRVPTSDIDWFCLVITVGYYKDCKVYVKSETKNEYRIDVFNISNTKSKEYKVFTEENGFEKSDRYDWYGNVPKSEVENIVQIVTTAGRSLKAPDKWDFQIPGDDNEFPRKVVPYDDV